MEYTYRLVTTYEQDGILFRTLCLYNDSVKWYLSKLPCSDCRSALYHEGRKLFPVHSIHLQMAWGVASNLWSTGIPTVVTALPVLLRGDTYEFIETTKGMSLKLATLASQDRRFPRLRMPAHSSQGMPPDSPDRAVLRWAGEWFVEIHKDEG